MTQFRLLVPARFVLSSILLFQFTSTTNTGFAAKPTQDILPASTKFSWSVTNQQEFNNRFDATQLGMLLSSPAMQPFLDDLPRQMREEASNHPLSVLWIDLGVERDDLQGLSEGEVAWGLVHPEGGDPSRVLLADITGRVEETDQFLQQIDEAMAEKHAKQTESQVGGVSVTCFDVPPTDKLKASKLYYTRTGDWLVCADSESMLQVLLKNLESDASDVLGQVAEYQEVVKQCRSRAGEQQPDAVLFVVPVDLNAALQQLAAQPDQRAVENLRIARKHNFDAISAVGCFLTVAQGDYDFHLRASVYAPTPWNNGMRICNFPNLKMEIPSWVHGDNHSVTLLNCDFVEFSKYFGPLFDDVYGEGEEGLYEDLKNSLGEDPEGPQVDVDQEIYAKLSPQTVLLARDALPVTPDSPQRLIAFSTTDEAALTASVHRALDADSTAELQEVAGRKAYFSYTEEEDDGFGSDLLVPQDRGEPSFITCVANGHLMFATDVKLLEDAIRATDGTPITDQAGYQAVAAHWESLGEQRCIQEFSQLDHSLLVNYELFRQGKKPNGGKSFKGLLNNIAMGEPPEVDPPQFDGSKLPAFEEVQQHFGLAGIAGIATENGWYLEGFLLKKD